MTCANQMTKTVVRISRSLEECRYLGNGIHPDESSKDCKSYIKCFNGRTSGHHRCPASSIFHPFEQSCVPDTLYDCPKSPRVDKLCKGKTDGIHIDPRYGCANYVKCSRGAPVSLNECAKGQMFDVHRKVCTFSPSTRCRHETYSSDCATLELGFYQNRSLESSCRDFFYCYNGRKTLLGCRVGEVFNGESCVDERIFSCPNRDADSCDTKENGYYRDSNLGCRSYFYCSSSRKYSFLCQDGQSFDGSRCSTKRHLEVCSKSTDCIRRSDGYYQDLQSSCTKYFYCKQADKVQVRFESS